MFDCSPQPLLPDISLWSKLAESDDWLAVHKPRGLSTVPARNTNEVSLLAQLQAAGYNNLRTTGRLDRAVGGIVLFAKHTAAQRRISNAWHHSQNRKIYRAITLRPPLPCEGVVDAPIGRGRKGSMKIGGQDARPAQTFYRTLRSLPDGRADVEARLQTGRRHQIRLHLASVGAPIAGDTYYLKAAEVLGGFPGPTPMPQPPDKIDLWCVELAIPGLGIMLRLAV